MATKIGISMKFSVNGRIF